VESKYDGARQEVLEKVESEANDGPFRRYSESLENESFIIFFFF
jgi:hypothetical protein